MKGANGELRLAEIVLTAADLEATERQAYLDDLAAAEPDLVAEARRRLAAAEELHDSFLVTPAVLRLGTVEGAAAEGEGKRGVSAAALSAEERYELGDRLGEGGMGRVVKAFDRQLGRTVALKFLSQEDPEILRLFLSEARNQARVKHDHVLEIYDSGELDGHPFISMHHAAAGTLDVVGDRLSLEGKVRLLCQAAEGLHAAHRQGLLHRDVKPSNILVERTDDGDLRALVTDFGLATEIGEADSTADGTVAGSPQYIAPERLLESTIEGAVGVDRRSDIYSLGVTMYRLLTGELPFAGHNTMEVLRQVVLHELPSPRQRKPDLPVELEAIILRSTASAPQARYASARAVADDLRRYLEGEVVEAYAASLAYRLTRFVLRNKVLMGMAAAAVMALTVAALAVTVFALRADAARQRAEARQGQAEELIHFMVFDLRDKLETLGRLDILTDLGAAAMTYFAAVPENELSETELSRRSRMLYQIGEVRVQQGDLAGAAAPFEESLLLARRLAALDPEDGERLFELGQAHFWVAYVSWEQGDLAAARQPFEDYLEVSRRLVAMDSSNLEWRQELSYAHSNLGSLLQAEGDLEAALEHFLATLAIDQELVAAQPTHDARPELAATHNTVGVVLQELGRLDEAGEHLRADLDIRRRLVEEAPEDPRARDFLGASHGHLGSHLFMRGNWPAAMEHFLAQRDTFLELEAHDPTNTAWRYKLAVGNLSLSKVALARKDLAAAKELWQLACREIDKLLALDGTVHKWRSARAMCLYHRAHLQKIQGDGTARDTALEAVQIFEELAAAQPKSRSDHRWLSQSLLLLGSLEVDRSAAVSAFERAEIAIAPFARDSREGSIVAAWTAALVCLGRLDEAQPGIEALNAQGYVVPGYVVPGFLESCSL